MYIYMHAYMYIYKDGCVYVYMHVYMYIWMIVCIYIYVCMYVNISVCIYACIYVCMYVLSLSIFLQFIILLSISTIFFNKLVFFYSKSWLTSVFLEAKNNKMQRINNTRCVLIMDVSGAFFYLVFLRSFWRL